jgi:hypothetical protein
MGSGFHLTLRAVANALETKPFAQPAPSNLIHQVPVLSQVVKL